MDKGAYGLHWFRRDLRIVGNPALERSLERHSGRVIGVFAFDRTFLARPDFSANRFLFFLQTLESLRSEMRERGGELLFLDSPDGPKRAFSELFEGLKTRIGAPKTVSWNRDYEPFARTRDAAMQEFFEREQGMETITERDHLLIEPTELLKDEKGGTYQVFTPFSKKWMALAFADEGNRRLRQTGAALKKGAAEFSLQDLQHSTSIHPLAPLIERSSERFDSWIRDTRSKVPESVANHLPKAGHAAAKSLLKRFSESALANYPVDRDIPSISGTSKMSIYLKNGSITVPQIIALLKLTPESPDLKFLTELIWREFYYHILYHRPSVEHEAFNPRYRNLEWENRVDYFEAWKEGRTGFPIVDAGMRQLNSTGWMHNRVRMIVASFLTKDLLVDYRWGERYFMEKLLDGDLAPNNGGWQWAASTGCDPQPYFRIFNPVSQGERFDPAGEYVLHWIPELAERFKDKTGKALPPLHHPHQAIVDHGVQREKALGLFKRSLPLSSR
jgi:deoxyribodipyrimidine photo-lyase